MAVPALHLRKRARGFIIDHPSPHRMLAPPAQSAARTVTVFDADVPPGVAFIRSLGRAGVAVIVGLSMIMTAGRFSQHATEVRRCPRVRRTDEFVGWLGDEFSRGTIDLVAPTSDYVSFCVAEALEGMGRKALDAGHPGAAATRVSLFKDAFGAAMERVGFPTPPWAAPTSLHAASPAVSTSTAPCSRSVIAAR